MELSIQVKMKLQSIYNQQSTYSNTLTDSKNNSNENKTENKTENKSVNIQCADLLLHWFDQRIEATQGNEVTAEIESLLPMHYVLDVERYHAKDAAYMQTTFQILAGTSSSGLALALELQRRAATTTTLLSSQVSSSSWSILDETHVLSYVNGTMTEVPDINVLQRLIEAGTKKGVQFVRVVVASAILASNTLNEWIEKSNRLLTSSLTHTSLASILIDDAIHALRVNVNIALQIRDLQLGSNASERIQLLHLLSIPFTTALNTTTTMEETTEMNTAVKEGKQNVSVLLRLVRGPESCKAVVELMKSVVMSNGTVLNRLNCTSLSDLSRWLVAKVIAREGAQGMKECLPVLHQMRVKHLVLLAKSFVYPSSTKEEVNDDDDGSKINNMLSLYDRQRVVETIMTTMRIAIDNDDPSNALNGQNGHADAEDTTLIPRALKQLGSWQCYLHAVEELEGSIASGEFSDDEQLEDSMKRCLERYSTRPKDAKKCFIEMAGRGLPASLLARVVMTHKKLKCNDPRANKLLIKLYDESFELLIKGFTSTNNTTATTTTTTNNNESKAASQTTTQDMQDGTQDDTQAWPPTTVLSARNMTFKTLSNLSCELSDVRNIETKKRFVRKLNQIMEDGAVHGSTLSTASKSAVLQVLTATATTSSMVEDSSMESRERTSEDETESIERKQQNTLTATGVETSNLSSSSFISATSATASIAAGSAGSAVSSSTVSTTSDHIDAMLETCTDLDSVRALLSILTGQDIVTLNDSSSTLFGLWVNQDADTVCNNYEQLINVKHNGTQSTKIRKESTKSTKMAPQWKKLLTIGLDLDIPISIVRALMRGPCRGIMKLNDELELLDHMETCPAVNVRSLLIVALSSAHDNIRKIKSQQYLKEWLNSKNETKETNDEDDEDEEEMDELTSTLVCRWPHEDTIHSNATSDHDNISITTMLQQRIIRGLCSSSSSSALLSSSSSTTSFFSPRAPSPVPNSPTGSRLPAPIPRRMSMRRISSPALVRRRLDTMELEARAPSTTLSSSSSTTTTTKSLSSISSLPRLPPPTTCTMKLFVIILVLSKQEQFAYEWLFEFYQIHSTMQTYDSGIACLEHYLRCEDDDENDGRESTRIQGKLRRLALHVLDE